MKRLFKITVILASVLFMACASKPAAIIEKGDKALRLNPDVVSGTVNNGISYYVLKNQKPKNRISLRLVVKAGSLCEEENQLGVAHLVEHMAFNGTEHFEKNSLIDYAESIGMDFGAEVNAYTSFEETVYKLEVPADDPSFLETALLIFKDWASAITFDQEELDKERGVIIEEWRSRLGLNGRIVDALLPFELADSEYVGKLPIGSMDVIANVTREEVVEFYKKWYRPENMSVIVTGDLNPSKVVDLVKTTMKDIPASTKKTTPVKGNVPARTTKDILVYADPEMPYTQIQLIAKDERYRPYVSEGDMKYHYLTKIVGNVLNMRFSEISSNPMAPWLGASTVNTLDTHTSLFNGVLFVPKDNNFEAAFQQMLEEIDRILVFGVTQTEFERERESFYAAEKNWYDKRNAITSQDRAEGLVTYCVTGEIPISDDDYINIVKKIYESITLEDVNQRAYEMLKDRGNMCIIYTPSSVAPTLPAKEEILGLWENYKSESLAEYDDSVAEGDLMERPAKKASVVSKRNLEVANATEYVLENGARIIAAISRSEKSRINMSVIRKGGTSLVSESEYMSCYVAPKYAIYSGLAGLDINQLQKYIADKNVYFNMDIYDHYEQISAYSTPESLEYMLQITNLFMSSPQFTEQGWYTTQRLIDQEAKTYDVQPGDYFFAKIMDFLHNGSVRWTPVTPEKAAMLNKEDAERFYKERFTNPADCTFIFYGDYNERELIDLCRYYIGNIKGDENVKEQGIYESFSLPAGITTKTYRKGQDNQGQVYIEFAGPLFPISTAEEYFTEKNLLRQLKTLIEIKLREIIREDKSGTYGVEAYSYMFGKQTRYYEFMILFGCEPAREKELAAEVIAAIEDLRKNLVDQTYIDKINESYKRSYERNQQDAQWCIELIEDVEVFGYVPEDAEKAFDSIPKLTTAESMREAAQKYLNTSNYFCAFLEPEK